MGFSFEMKQVPVKEKKSRSAAGGGFDLSDEALAHPIFKLGRAGDEIAHDCGENKHSCDGRERKREMTQEETAQTVRLRGGADSGRVIVFWRDGCGYAIGSFGRTSTRALRWGGFGATGLAGRGFERRIENFDVALAAQIGEPCVEEHVHLLFKQNFLNARSGL